MLTKADGDQTSAGFSNFYKKRRRVYGALLLFVIAAGAPIAAVPKLRERLIARAWNLKEAIAGRRAPVEVAVGQNQEPLPEEFRRPAPTAMRLPLIPNPVKKPSTPEGGPFPRRYELHPTPPAETSQTGAAAGAQGEVPGVPVEGESTPASSEPKYQQGKAEREAFDLLISSSPEVAEIVNGNNPAFKFRSWDAAGRGEDTYWVRLKLQAEGQPESDYIWQVKLGAKQVRALNYNARNIR